MFLYSYPVGLYLRRQCKNLARMRENQNLDRPQREIGPSWLARESWAYFTGLRFLRAETDSPVFFRLPALPVALMVTSSSNSPPIISLHGMQTSVSGIASRRAVGIGSLHFRQSLTSISTSTFHIWLNFHWLLLIAPGANPGKPAFIAKMSPAAWLGSSPKRIIRSNVSIREFHPRTRSQTPHGNNDDTILCRQALSCNQWSHRDMR